MMSLGETGRLRIAVCLVFCLGATGCGRADDPDYTALANVCEPKMEAVLQEWVDQGMAGSITILGGDRQCSIGLGVADRSTDRQITAETMFSIGSITKAVTAAAILKLADDGRLDLDDTVGQHLDGLGGGSEDLEIRDLLLHTSGLTGYHGQDHRPMTKQQAIEGISDLELVGSGQFNYTNSGYSLLGLIIEEITERGYRQYVLDEVLRDGDGEPIGAFWDGEPAAKPRAFGYRFDGTQGQSGEFAGPHWALEANGGIAMTTLQMAEWARALWSGDILSPSATEMLNSTRHQSELGVVEHPGWGQIVDQAIGERVFATSGGGGSIGHSMSTLWLPDSERVIVMATSALTNTTGGFEGDLLLPLLNGTGLPYPVEVQTVDADQARRLVGTYRLEGTDELIVISSEEQGFRVEATGAESLKTLFPLPPGVEAEVARHEQHAIDFIDGTSARGQTERATFEAENGAILDVELIGSACCAIETIFAVEVEGGETVFLALEMNERGGSEGIGVGPPGGWFVAIGGEIFESYRSAPEDTVQLTWSQDTIEIVSRNGTATATKIG